MCIIKLLCILLNYRNIGSVIIVCIFLGHKSAPADQRGKSGDGDNDSLIAFPNDRYASVRPTERGKRFR